MSRKPSVLVVDDHVENVRLLHAHLTSEGYDVITAYDGAEGLQKVYDEWPDVVLLDVMMPKIDGFEVCRRLRGSKETALIPIIMITALSDFESYLKGLEAGADDFLVKPVNYLELKARTKCLLKMKNLIDENLAQERIRKILINLTPLLLKNVSGEVRTLFISEMCNNIANLYGAKGTVGRDLTKLLEFTNSILSEIGGDPIVLDVEDGKGTVMIEKCPWEESEAKNPLLCMICRGIYSRILSDELGNVIVNIETSILDGDDRCLFNIQSY
ncbi:MAG: response regulator [Thermoplasmata archaeon]|nr:response regulator [Thermoplasmata archaeon]